MNNYLDYIVERSYEGSHAEIRYSELRIFGFLCSIFTNSKFSQSTHIMLAISHSVYLRDMNKSRI